MSGWLHNYIGDSWFGASVRSMTYRGRLSRHFLSVMDSWIMFHEVVQMHPWLFLLGFYPIVSSSHLSHSSSVHSYIYKILRAHVRPYIRLIHWCILSHIDLLIYPFIRPFTHQFIHLLIHPSSTRSYPCMVPIQYAAGRVICFSGAHRVTGDVNWPSTRDLL